METIGDRIKKKRLELKLTQTALAKAVGVERAAVSQWESGQTKGLKAENLLNVAEALGVSPEWLVSGERRDKLVTLGKPMTGRHFPPGKPLQENGVQDAPAGYLCAMVPLISREQAGQWNEIADSFEPEPTQWRATTAKVGPRAFALRIQDDSMTNPHGKPSIPEDSIVIVDPDVQPDNGKIVVVRLEGSDKATIKKLVIDGPNRYLKPLNPAYPVIEIDSNCMICGVVRQVVNDL